MKNWQFHTKKKNVPFDHLCILIKVKRLPSWRQKQSKNNQSFHHVWVCIEMTSPKAANQHQLMCLRHNLNIYRANVNEKKSSFGLRFSYNLDSRLPCKCEVNLSWCQFGVRFCGIDYEKCSVVFHSKNKTNWFQRCCFAINDLRLDFWQPSICIQMLSLRSTSMIKI